MVQSQVSRALEKVPGKVWEALVQSQVRLNKVPEKVSEKVWEILEHAEVFPALGFAACFTKIGKNKTMRLLRIPPKLIFRQTQMADIHREPPQADLKPKSAKMPHMTWRFSTETSARFSQRTFGGHETLQVAITIRKAPKIMGISNIIFINNNYIYT